MDPRHLRHHTLRSDQDAEARGNPEGLLRARHYKVYAPLIHSQLLPPSGADGVNNDERRHGSRNIT